MSGFTGCDRIFLKLQSIAKSSWKMQSEVHPKGIPLFDVKRFVEENNLFLHVTSSFTMKQ